MIWKVVAGVVKILLERSDVNPNTPDIYGLTPLSWAAQNGHEKITQLLRDWPDFIPRYVASPQPLELSPPKPPKLSEPHSKRIRRF